MFYDTEEAMASKEKELQKKIQELEVWLSFMNSRYTSFKLIVAMWIKNKSFVKSCLINILSWKFEYP